MTKKSTSLNDIYGQDEVIEMLDLAAKNDMPALIIGDTGTGKTTVVKHLAEQAKAKWVRFNLTGETTVDDFVGKWTLKEGETVWNDGILLQAMKQGKWLIVDEINVALPEILFVLHSLLDDDKYIVVPNNNGEIVKPVKGFRFFATMNPVDEYAGTKDLNKAFKSRFNIIAYMNYPADTIEQKVLVDKTGLDAGSAVQMVAIANKIRDAKKADEVFYTCSTRDLMQWAAVYQKLGGQKTEQLQRSFQYTVMNKANGDGEKIKAIYESLVGRFAAIAVIAPDLQLETLENKAREIEALMQKLESSRAQMAKEVTDQVLEELRIKLGALSGVIETESVENASTKVVKNKPLPHPDRATKTETVEEVGALI